MESGLLVNENGGARAFREVIFCEEIGGSTSALTVSFAVAVPVAADAAGLAVEMGPAAPFVGAAAGLMAGSLSGMVG